MSSSSDDEFLETVQLGVQGFMFEPLKKQVTANESSKSESESGDSSPESSDTETVTPVNEWYVLFRKHRFTFLN